jgi:beta-glucuronidase
MNLDRRTLLATVSALAVVAPSPVSAQQQTLAAPAETPDPFLIAALHRREKVSLDGQWNYLIDPHDSARRKPTYRRRFWLEEPQTLGGPLVEYDWDTSPELRVPGDWNTQVAELAWYDGTVYLRRLFDAPRRGTGDRLFIVFEAVNYRATVWVNGQEIGTHEGGFTPFAFELTEPLRSSGNSLVVRADSRHDIETLPSIDCDWKNYGGITRSAWLVSLPATFIRDAFIRLDGDAIRADIRLEGRAQANQAVTMTIPGLGISLRGRTDADGYARLSAPAPSGLALWSPQDPHLYQTRVMGAGDEYSDEIGFRRIETRGREILLNGEPIFLRGISLHEETIGENPTRAVSDAEAERLLRQALDLGCNFVRLAHYPHTPAMARLADRLGLLVWAEIPVYWEDVSYDSDKTLALGRQMMTELVLRDRNHASIVFWSVANETPTHASRNHFLRTIIADVRRLDPTRLITAALNKNVDVGGVRDGESHISVQDELGVDLDVIALNQYEGWYGQRTPAQIFDQVRFSTTYEKPLIMSEFGADALAGHHGDRRERWNEEHQAWIFEETLRCIDRDGFAGVSPWLLKDFRSPRRWHGRFQNYWNRKGVISERGERKLAFDVLRAYYAAKASS